MLADIYDIVKLGNFLKINYEIEVAEVELFRSMIGHVYFINGNEYVFKLYRPGRIGDAKKSVEVLGVLHEKGFPAAELISNKTGENLVKFKVTGLDCAGYLYKYIDGEESNSDNEIIELGRFTGMLHKKMDDYADKIEQFTSQTYIGDYIDILKQKGFDREKTAELKFLGNMLWEKVAGLPRGFCHGDLHTGNMLRTESGYVLYDFDDCSGDFPAMDAAYLCDGSDFNHFDASAFDKTAMLLEKFYTGYSDFRTLTEEELQSVFYFIPIRHYQIIARIANCKGLKSISMNFLDQQYHWIKNWLGYLKQQF